MLNIPIYRAKKIDNDEYVIGFLIPPNPDFEEGICVFEQTPMCKDTGHREVYMVIYKIDPTTLAINFPSMLDSHGNKIFASLSEDGKGGDCTFMENGYNETFMWDCLNACIVLKSPNYEAKLFRNGNSKQTTFNTYKVIGINQ